MVAIVFQKNTAIIRKFFQSYNNWVLNDCCVFYVIYNILSSILMSKKKLCEWGLWNNSWVKNLPVDPLALRRKTPGQLYPTFQASRAGPKLLTYFLSSGFLCYYYCYYLESEIILH